MNLKFSFLFATISLFTSCNNNPEESKENKTVTELNASNCYSYTNNNDTIFLEITNANGSVTGTLVFNYYQKDKNSGSIEGRIKDELLLADYTFFSEGVQSVRQIAFKKDGKRFIEGFGETEDKNGKTVFKNPDSLNFNNNIQLSEVECEK